MTDPAQDTLFRVGAIIRDVLAEDDDPNRPITAETSFAEDLELESIEFVAMAEKMVAEFGDQIDFQGWLAGLELDEIVKLRVGDLVEFIDSCRSSGPAA